MRAGENPYRDESKPVEREEELLNPPELARKPKKRPKVTFLVMKWLLMILVPAGVFSKYLFTPVGRHPGQWTACRTNLKNLASALEMYSTDYSGQYPESLERLLAGNYLKTLPTCPAAGHMTYTDYQVSRNPTIFLSPA